HRIRVGPGVRSSLERMGDVEALKRGETQVIDVDAMPPSPEVEALLASGVHVYMVVPMIAGGELIGALSFGGEPGPFPADQVGIAQEAAAQLAIAIAQARLHERVKQQAAELEVRVAVRAERIGEALHVRADRQRLQQVLLNLLSNGVKYNRAGGTVTVACRESPASRLRIEVTDTGPGITADKLARLFTPFDRLGAEASAVEGTGLGLALSKSLVEAMGGALQVRSQPEEGCTFWVELAVVAGPGEREVAAVSAPVVEEAGPREGQKILDMEGNRSHLTP